MTSEQEREQQYNEEAAKRLALLDRLYPQCKWELFPMQIDSHVEQSRNLYNKILAEQDAAEQEMGL